MPVAPGDHVVFPASAGVWVEVEEERLLVCTVNEVLGVLEEIGVCPYCEGKGLPGGDSCRSAAGPPSRPARNEPGAASGASTGAEEAAADGRARPPRMGRQAARGRHPLQRHPARGASHPAVAAPDRAGRGADPAAAADPQADRRAACADADLHAARGRSPAPLHPAAARRAAAGRRPRQQHRRLQRRPLRPRPGGASRRSCRRSPSSTSGERSGPRTTSGKRSATARRRRPRSITSPRSSSRPGTPATSAASSSASATRSGRS